jgi:hypothetical protein
LAPGCAVTVTTVLVEGPRGLGGGRTRWFEAIPPGGSSRIDTRNRSDTGRMNAGASDLGMPESGIPAHVLAGTAAAHRWRALPSGEHWQPLAHVGITTSRSAPLDAPLHARVVQAEEATRR